MTIENQMAKEMKLIHPHVVLLANVVAIVEDAIKVIVTIDRGRDRLQEKADIEVGQERGQDPGVDHLLYDQIEAKTPITVLVVNEDVVL
jgi:hypothetical protein